MKAAVLICLPISVCVLALDAGADPPPRTASAHIVSPRLAEPMVIDGTLGAAGWTQAAHSAPLVTLGGAEPTVQDHTEARVAHDATTLYIAVLCRAPAAQDLPELGTDDRSIYQRDHVEIFLDPSPGTNDYLQFVVDRAGNRRARSVSPDAGVAGEDLTESWQAATAQTADGWTAEIAVPFGLIGVESPAPGDLWRFKVCRDGGSEGALSWPPNRTTSFHNREADGELYFETMNLLENGDFETATPKADGVPPPWYASLTSAEVNNARQGSVETVTGDQAFSGDRAVRKTKLQAALWWPQIWSPGLTLEADAAYEFSVMARGSLPHVNLRANCRVAGQTVKLSQTFDTPATWKRLHYFFKTPAGTTSTSVGLSAPSGISGEVFYDQALLRRILRAPRDIDHAVPLTAEPEPDPVQGLEAFMERQGHKPYDLFQRDGDLMTLRLMFQDRRFGTWVWMLDNSPTVDHGGTASVWSAWNVNGATIYVEGTRHMDGEPRRGWFIHSDFSRMRPAPGGRPAVWAPDNPDIYYGPIGPVSNVTRNNWRTGEQTVLAEWEPLSWTGSTKRVYGLTSDNRYVFVDLPNRGVFVPFTHDENLPIPRLSLYDGRPVGPNGRSVGSNHYCVIYNHEAFGDLIALRTGMLVDPQTGECTNIAGPLCGNTNYLRAFHEGRVHFPEGDEWKAYGLDWFTDGVRLPTDLSLEELYQLWLYLPHVTHGHESPSPNREFIASDGGTTIIARVRDGATQTINISPNGTNYHLHWGRHPRFFVGWVRGWHFGSYLRPEKANIEFQIFADETYQPIVDTKHRLNGYYSGGDFSMFSPDATKIHYGSSMTGRFRNYIAVMARPRPPRTPQWQARGNALQLSWEPSRYSRETLGYLVYRGENSGGPYALITPEPLGGTTYIDSVLRPATPYYYVITALEHSGLESGYSDEIARAGLALPADVDEPLVVYAEAEHAIRDLPTEARPGLAIGVDRWTASDWYYLYRHPESHSGSATLDMHIPAAGQYVIWTRIRSAEAGHARWTVTLNDHRLAVNTPDSEWTWVRVGDQPLELTAGKVTITLETEDHAAQLDVLCLANNSDFQPIGPRPEDTTPPPTPTRLRVENVRERVNRLTWQGPQDPRHSHYHVYASPEAEPAVDQTTRIGSPTEEEMIDWGLRAGTTYHYAVTAVDRRGNESAPARATLTTPPRGAPPFERQLAFADADLAGPFEQAEAGGLRAETYVVPEDPATNRATWQVQIPHQGTYYLWLRHLLRGKGGRGQSVRQNVQVRANGRHVATLGGGRPDLNVPDRLIAEGNPLAAQLWTWVWPGEADLDRVELPAGEVEIELSNLAPDIRYDVLVITDEPAFVPRDGRLRQR